MNSERRSLVRLVRGPIMLILLGTLFAMEQFTPYGFWRTWPVLIIAFGILKLVERIAAGPERSGGYTAPGGDS